MDNETKLTFKELYTDLVAASTEAVMPENGFTVRQYARDIGRSRARAGEILREKVDEGSLEVGVFLLDGHRTKVFWFSELEEESDGRE